MSSLLSFLLLLCTAANFLIPYLKLCKISWTTLLSIFTFLLSPLRTIQKSFYMHDEHRYSQTCPYQVKQLSERNSCSTWPKTGTSLTSDSSSSWQSLRSRTSIFPTSPSDVSFRVSSWMPFWVKFDPVIFTVLTVQI